MKSSEIEIASFRQILILPLTLTGGDKSVSEIVQERADAISGTSGWEEEPDHLAHLGGAEDRFAYAEFVYFHAYIQDFLFDRADARRGNRGQRPLRLFRRPQPGNFEVSVNIEGRALGQVNAERIDVALPIVRMSLYLFESGVAALAVEVGLNVAPKVRAAGVDQPMSLAHAQALQNALRRIYPPYFSNDDLDRDSSENIPEYPARVVWSGSPAEVRLKPSEWIGKVAADRRNPLDPVWRSILAPLAVESSARDEGPRWRQIIDERIPSMVCIGVRSTTGMERHDFVRLCFLDDPGQGYPYSEDFLTGFERQHCYDRHWFGGDGTRYLFAGYSMVMIGSGDPAKPDDFFHGVLAQHFRRHYFQMGLLIQLQFAALLSLSHRASEAVRNKRNGDEAEFRRQMLEIENEILTFEQRYWFTQVSNQLQAREIYAQWLGMTGVADIYAEVKAQVHAANAYLDAREQVAQTSAATRLSVIATLGVIVGAAYAFLGMNVLAAPDFLKELGVPKELVSPRAGNRGLWHMVAAHAATFFAVLTLSCLLGWSLLRRYSRLVAPTRVVERDLTSVTGRLNRDLRFAVVACLSACIISAAAWWLLSS